MEKKAVLISGATTSGKSMFAKRLGALTGFEIFHEDIGDQIIRMSSLKEMCLSNTIFEHNQIFERVENFCAVFDYVYAIFIFVDGKILRRNFQKRLDMFSYGDFLKYDPVEQQREICKRFKLFSINFPNRSVKWLTLSVVKYKDYDKCLTNILGTINA